MSTAITATGEGHGREDHGHDPHLAHHFETPQQQMETGKLGMWIFLGTEILMFGGLFCAYAVYRHNYPEVFQYAHQYLDKSLGAINTAILIASSLTMAWAVRLAQLGKRPGLVICLALTLLGGLGFMAIKGIEYSSKWEHHLWVGAENKFHFSFKGPQKPKPPEAPVIPATPPEAGSRFALFLADPNAGGTDAAAIRPNFASTSGLAHERSASHGAHLDFADLRERDRARVNAFFSVYFCMTGLHAIHVLIGMGLISWVMFRAVGGAFGPRYFAPVDLVGLYWHLVDLIWIFLFPLLYLIH